MRRDNPKSPTGVPIRSLRCWCAWTAVISAAGAATPAAGDDIDSVRTAGGLWSNTAAWAHTPAQPTPRFPANTVVDSFFVGLADQGVTLDVSVTVSSLDIGGGGSLTWANPGSPQLVLDAGPISNAGTMTLGEGDRLGIGGLVNLTGAGTTMLTDDTARIGAVAGGELLITFHTIEGFGQVGDTAGGFDLTNAGGTIVANVGGETLRVDTAGPLAQVGGGMLAAANGGVLLINGTAIDNAGGIIDAGVGSTVSLVGADINGGTLQGAGEFFIPRPLTNRFADLTLMGTTVTLEGGATLNLAGTVTNDGQVTLEALPAVGDTNLGVQGPATLAGSGTVTLTGLGFTEIIPADPTAVLTNGADHIIEGTGGIGNPLNGLDLINEGTILANADGNRLDVTPRTSGTGFVTNRGMLRATDGGILRLGGAGGAVTTQEGDGQIVAEDDSTVQLSNAIVDGGLLLSSGAGKIDVVFDSELRDLTSNAVVNVLPNGQLRFLGRINNLRAVNLNGRDLLIQGDTTLEGLGNINLGNGGRVFAPVGVTPTLTNINNDIAGAGLIGNQTLSVDNRGTISANVAQQELALGPDVAGQFINSGTLQATNGGVLRLGPGTYQNNGTGGIVADDDSQVRIGVGSSPTITQADNAEIVARQNAHVDVGGSTRLVGGKLATRKQPDTNDLDETSFIRVSGIPGPRFENLTNEGLVLVDQGNLTAQDILNKGQIRVTDQRTLFLEGTLTLDTTDDNGNVVIDGTGGVFGTVLRIREGVTIQSSQQSATPGIVTLTGLSPGGTRQAFLFGTGADPELTNLANIEGYGIIGATTPLGNRLRIINRGNIAATDPAEVLTLRPDSVNGNLPDLTNAGNILATNGATLELAGGVVNSGAIFADPGSMLRIDAAVITNVAPGFAPGGGGAIGGGAGTAAPGTIRAEDNALVELRGGTVISRGTLSTTGSGLIRAAENATLFTNLTNAGRFEVANGVTVSLVFEEAAGEDTLTNAGTVTLAGSGAPTRLRVVGEGFLRGGGTVVLSDHLNNEVFGFGAGGNNDRLVNADNIIRGAGTIGEFMIFQNDPDGTVIADGVNALTLVTGANLGGDMIAEGPGGMTLFVADEFFNGGRVIIKPGSAVRIPGGDMGNAGTVTVDGTISVGLIRNTGIVGGGGTINGRLFNSDSGSILPSPFADSLDPNATLTVDGDLEQDGGGTLEIGIDEEVLLFVADGNGSPFGNDAVVVTGDATLAGTLELVASTFTTPALGTQFELLTAAGVTGVFDRVVGLQIAPNRWLAVTYEPTRVLATAALPGDANLSGLVEQGDLDAILQNWGETAGVSWVTGDTNGSGQVEQGDLDAVLLNWGDTAAPDLRGRTVPEPATAAAALSVLALARSRRPVSATSQRPRGCQSGARG